MRMSHRIRYAAGLSVVALVTSAGAASAHHCYKEEWTEAAYQRLAAGGTAWVSLSDVGTMFLVPPEHQADCGWVVDEAVAEWMAAEGLTQEPLIHVKATVGGGAYYKKGMEPAPFSYLGEDDFRTLGALVEANLPACTGGS